MPTILVLIVLIVFPLAQVIFQSFTNAKLFEKPSEFIGIQNYIKLMHDGRFWNSVNAHSSSPAGLYACRSSRLGCAACSSAIYDFQMGRSLFICYVLPPVVVGIIWKMLFSPLCRE